MAQNDQQSVISVPIHPSTSSVRFRGIPCKPSSLSGGAEAGTQNAVRIRSMYSVADVIPTTKPHRGLIGCVIVLLSVVLGAGIFAAPQEILRLTGNPGLTLLIWFIYGIFALLASICYVELGTTFPVSGGDYAYLNECFGQLPAFLFQWSNNLVITPVSLAILALVISKNLLNPYLCDTDGVYLRWASTLLAIGIILIFCYANCKSATFVERIQGVLMIINILAISLIVCCGISHMILHGVAVDFTIDVPHPTTNLSKTATVKFQSAQIVLAFYQSSFSYSGYSYLGFITEELDNPVRNLPLGVCISIPIIIFLNVFVNFCYMATLSQRTIYSTEAIANEMFRAVLPVKYQTSLGWFAPSLIAVAVTGGLMSVFVTCSRIPFSGARNGHFPKIFCLVHVNNLTPIVSLVFTGCLSCFYVLVGNIPTLISVAVYLEVSFNCFSIYGLIYKRIRSPKLHRPIKLPIILPIAYAFVATVMFFVPIVTLGKNNSDSVLASLAGAAFVIFTGLPVYYIFIHKACEFKVLNKIQDKLIIRTQKLWKVVPPSLNIVEFEVGDLDLGEFEDRR